MTRDNSTTLPLSDSLAAAVPPGKDDRRAKMPEPLPVRLVTVEDASLPAGAGQEVQLDAFYVDLLGFEREEDESRLIYRADNFRILCDVEERPPSRTDMRALGIEVLSLRETEQKLTEAEIKYERRKGLHPGQESLLLQDPAGNWIELTGRSEFR